MNELLRKDRKLSFLEYAEAGKLVLELQVNFSKVFVADSPQMRGKVGLQVFQPSHLHNTICCTWPDQPLSDKSLKTAFRRHENTAKHTK